MGPTIYIPSFNGRERLAALLDSLALQSRPCRVVVAENGSTDGTVEMLRERRDEVEVREMGGNIGFGPALNRAIEGSPGDPIILLNADVTCPPDFTEALLDRAATGAGMVAAVLVGERDPGIIDSAGVVADRTLMGFDYLNGEPLAVARTAAPPLGPTGGAALYDAEAFRKCGGFDERIFLYYEDLDLAVRMRRAGARCELAAEAVAEHAYSQGLGAATTAKYRRTGWSRGWMLRRYGVLSRPRNVARVLAVEGAICLGQIVFDRSLGGLAGRLAGWRDARGVERLEVDEELLCDIGFKQALALRRRRRGPVRSAAT